MGVLDLREPGALKSVAPLRTLGRSEVEGFGDIWVLEALWSLEQHCASRPLLLSWLLHARELRALENLGAGA